jgi:hypothetical protein
MVLIQLTKQVTQYVKNHLKVVVKKLARDFIAKFAQKIFVINARIYPKRNKCRFLGGNLEDLDSMFFKAIS